MIIFPTKPQITESHITSSLYDENTFYSAFIKDLKTCKREVIIESPYITSQRTALFKPILLKLIQRGIKVYIVTRSPIEHSTNLANQAELEIRNFESIGVQVLLCVGNHHRKLAIIDREVLWEGSLNILSQGMSREIMHRITGGKFALQMFNYLKFVNYI